MDDIVQASPANSDPTWAADMEERRALPSLTAINFAHPNVGSQRVHGPRPHYVFLRYAYSRNVLTGHIERWCALSSDVNPHGRALQKKEGAMKPRSHAVDYYRRILSMQPHALKRLDEGAAIVKRHRGQEITNESGSAGHWYYVITGAVGRSKIRSDGRRQIVDLMLPRDFFFVSESTKRQATIEAMPEETVLASHSGGRVELIAARGHPVAR